jgi:hypothetical protein
MQHGDALTSEFCTFYDTLLLKDKQKIKYQKNVYIILAGFWSFTDFKRFDRVFILM